MQYVYILQSIEDGALYIGCTSNLKNRLKLHNSGRVHSTRNRIPLKLVYYEAYVNKDDAYEREKYLKTGWGRNFVRKTIKHYLRSKKI